MTYIKEAYNIMNMAKDKTGEELLDMLIRKFGFEHEAVIWFANLIEDDDFDLVDFYLAWTMDDDDED